MALDVRRDYLDITAARAREARLTNVETRLVGTADCGLARASTDIVWMSQVDQYVPNRAPYFAGVVRALRPHGKLVLINYEHFRDADVAAVADLAAPVPPSDLSVICPGMAPSVRLVEGYCQAGEADRVLLHARTG